jgi:hypothetical protein
MADLALIPRGTINTKRHRAPINSQNTIRVYNHSPGYIAVQLRREREYSTVILSADETSRLATLLGVVVSDI